MENPAPKVDTTTTPPAPADKSNEVVDYKAMLDKAQAEKAEKDKQLLQAEHVIQKLKKEKKEIDDLDLSLDVDPEEIKKAAIEASREETKKFLGEQTKEVLDEELSRITDPNKRELVKFHLENSIKRSGFTRSSILKDIQIAEAIADAPRVIAEKKELERTLGSKASQSTVNTSGQMIEKENPQGQLSAAEEKQVQIIASRTGKTVEEVRARVIANKNR